MTGFGAASRRWDGPRTGARVDVEIRSVNARFLELKIRHPFGHGLEPALRRGLEARLGRGRVDLSIFIRTSPAEVTSDGADLEALGVDEERVRDVVAAARQVTDLAARQGLELSSFTALELLRFLQGARGTTAEAATEAPPFLQDLVQEALEQLCSFRHQEGEALGVALRELVDTLGSQVQALQRDLPAERERLQQRWIERVAELCARAGVTPLPAERVAQEVALLVTRGDVEEEVARIGSHLEQMRQTLDASPRKGQGKKLEFLTQELLREVSTVGSKILSHDGSQVVIEAKSTIERIREQVQNVE